MQLAPARDLESVRRLSLLNSHADIRLNLFEKPVSEVAGGDKLSLSAGKRTVVDNEVHRNCRLVYLYKRQRLYAVRCACRLPDVYVAYAGNTHDISGGGLIDLNTVETLKLIKP